MTSSDLRVLWSIHFETPFPEGAEFFWRNYDEEAVRVGFSSLARKLQTSTFPNLNAACRYATAAMKTASFAAEQNFEPAPLPKVVTHD